METPGRPHDQRTKEVKVYTSGCITYGIQQELDYRKMAYRARTGKICSVKNDDITIHYSTAETTYLIDKAKRLASSKKTDFIRGLEYTYNTLGFCKNPKML